MVPIPATLSSATAGHVGIGGDTVHVHVFGPTSEYGTPALSFDVVIESCQVTPTTFPLCWVVTLFEVVFILFVPISHNTD